jgi:hypothetical protein
MQVSYKLHEEESFLETDSNSDDAVIPRHLWNQYV